ncbi:MAG: hypothetical protein ACSHW6_08175 [Sulfitobacter geojensis]|nr:hypothetical protein [Sulfitobacter geojensis]KHA52764.1 hypothetical protein Z947_3074 [Sulfitobacter geojensis]NYI28568.1 PBP1b-binding outer membrane lipoprotein LpoB [Sulfitobacter geojensis]
MKHLMMITTLAALLAGCTPPEAEAPVEEPEQEIIPLSIALPT